MGTTYRFLAIGEETEAVPDWFRRQPNPPEVLAKSHGLLLYFRAFGPLVMLSDGSGIDVRRSPLVSLFPPLGSGAPSGQPARSTSTTPRPRRAPARRIIRLAAAFGIGCRASIGSSPENRPGRAHGITTSQEASATTIRRSSHCRWRCRPCAKGNTSSASPMAKGYWTLSAGRSGTEAWSARWTLRRKSASWLTPPEPTTPSR